MVLFYLLHVLWFLLPFTACHSLPSEAEPRRSTEAPASREYANVRRASNVSVPRDVYLVSDITPAEFQVSTIDGKTIFNSYVALYIMGTDVDGPLRIEMGADLNVLSTGQATPGDISMTRVFDLGTGSTPEVIAAKAGRTASLQGKTSHRNVDFLDPNTGLGIVPTAWAIDTEYRVGPKYQASLNSGHALMQRILKILDITPNADAQTMWQRADRWQYEFEDSSSYNITQVYHDVLIQNNPTLRQRGAVRPRGSQKRTLNPDRERTVWLMKNSETPSSLAEARSLWKKWGPAKPVAVSSKTLPVVAESEFGVGNENTVSSVIKSGRAARFHEATGIDPDPVSEPNPVPPTEDDPVSANEKIQPPPPADPDRISFIAIDPVDDAGSMVPPAKGASHDDNGKPAKGPTGVSSEVGDTQKISFTNIAKDLRTIGVTVSAVVSALGVVADLALGIFVMFQDFVNGEWVFGAVAGVGAVTAAGVTIAAELASEGPIGWALALVIGLITMLPGILDKKPAGHIGNNLEILQWSFYGNRDSTGNEECNKQAKVNNCTVVNGPGSITKGTQLNNFDSIVFMLQFNAGYAMSLPDIAKAFTVYNTTAPADAKDLAIIECNNKPRQYVGGWHGVGTVVGDDPTLCNHPKFSINRKLITLPMIGDTAANVYNRIIPAPGGDCKLLTRPGDQNYPDYNLVLTGVPCAITCGLKSGTNVQGVVVSPGNESTDGQNGGYIAPPDMPKGPGFPPPLTDKTSVCLGTTESSDSLCLPNGTYSGQSYYKFGSTNTLKLPTKAYVETSYQTLGPDTCEMCPGTEEPAGHIFNQPITNGKNGTFNSDMKALGSSGVLNVFTPSDPLLACLFEEPQYGGDVACFGEGGGALPSNWNKKAQSIMLHGDAWAWIYGDHYGDYGGVALKGNQPDLAAQDYGVTSETFSKNVTAIWVKKAE